jgi:hypothetical protein
MGAILDDLLVNISKYETKMEIYGSDIRGGPPREKGLETLL